MHAYPRKDLALQLVLWRMLEQGPRFRPCDAEALRFYRSQGGQPVSVQQAQQAQKAQESLRQRTPAMVWKRRAVNTRWTTPPCSCGRRRVWRRAPGRLSRLGDIGAGALHL